MTTTTFRPLHEIAAEIYATWRNSKTGKSAVWFGAVPYLEAMASLNSITDKYFADRADDIVAYFLGNATTWRGEDAKRIKAELKAMLKASGR
jgi:hypothetical protein